MQQHKPVFRQPEDYLATFNMVTTSPIANGSHHATGNQLKFMNALPSDIIIEIFSFLTQQDSLTCMAVCRDWYDFIPQYAQDLWKELHLDLGDLLKDHKRREKLLGSHVESVVIKQGRTVVAKDVLDASSIHKLRAWGCTNIQFIGKTIGKLRNGNALII